MNYNKAVTSKTLNLLNDGEQTMKITDVSFKNKNFSTSLHKDLVLDSRESVDFNITFAAGETDALVEDEMTVTFDNVPAVTLPVSGNAVASLCVEKKGAIPAMPELAQVERRIAEESYS